jgi:hypothetical protein
MSIGKLEEYVTGAGSWDHYVERLNCFFAANEIESDVRKVNILLSICGAKTYELIRSLVSPDLPNTRAFDELISLVSSHYNPKPSVIVQRFQFNTRLQNEGELISSFVSELRKLAEHCEFGNYRNDMIRDRLVVGVKNIRIQRCLLADSGLTFETAYDTAIAMEAAEKNADLLQKLQSNSASGSLEPSTEVNRVEPNTIQSRRLFTCYRCGLQHSHPGECRHIQTICNRCKKRGHLAKMC